MKKERDFKGVWIPKEIWLDTNLTWVQKLFFTEIESLDNENGCFASNSYFADFFNLSTVRVSQIINELVKKGYIVSEVFYKKGTKEIEGRVLKVSLRGYQRNLYDPIKESFNTPIKESFKDNNTFINNTINNTINNNSEKKFSQQKKEISEREKEFYVLISEYKNDFPKETLRAFFDYWSEKNQTGKKMKFELQQTFEIKKRLQTWFKNENKFKQNGTKQQPKQDIFSYYSNIVNELEAERKGSSNTIDISED